MNFVSAFSVVNALFISGFYAYIATEGGILKLNMNNYEAVWKYPFKSVQHIAYISGNVLFVSDGTLYLLREGANFMYEKPQSIKFVGNPLKMGVDDRLNLVMNYGSSLKAYDIGGFERNVGSKLTYESVKNDGSLKKNPFLKPDYIYDSRLGRVKLHFVREFANEWLVGTDGLGLLVYPKNSSVPRLKLKFGTFNTIYTSFHEDDELVIIGGDRGVDILKDDSVFSFKLDCAPVDFLFYYNRTIYMVCKNYIYRSNLYGNYMMISNLGNYLNVKFVSGRLFVIYRDRVYEVFSNRYFNFSNVYDVLFYRNNVMFILKNFLISSDGSFRINMELNDWIDYDIKATSDGETIYICTRFGVMTYKHHEWKRFNYPLGNIQSCRRLHEKLYIVANNKLFVFDGKGFRRIFTNLNQKFLDVSENYILSENILLKMGL